MGATGYLAILGYTHYLESVRRFQV
jgi:hypothetical protein